MSGKLSLRGPLAEFGQSPGGPGTGSEGSRAPQLRDATTPSLRPLEGPRQLGTVTPDSLGGARPRPQGRVTTMVTFSWTVPGPGALLQQLLLSHLVSLENPKSGGTTGALCCR